MKVLLDSVFVYLDSVPELRDSILSHKTITVNKNCQINLYDAEYKNLRIHLQYCLLPRYSKTERFENTKNLINYFITEEIKQFNARLYSKKETHKIFKILSDSSFYTSVHTKIYDSYWANSDKIIILVGQVHNKSFADEENKLVKIVQDDIFELFDLLYKNGIDLIIDEGKLIREYDWRIPTKTPTSIIIKDYGFKKLYEFDSLHETTVYGCENMDIHKRADSIIVAAIFMNNYCSKIDSIKFPIHKDSLMLGYTQNFSNCLKILPNLAGNFDSLKSINIALEKLLAFPERLSKSETVDFYRSMYNEGLKIGINERNIFFIHSIQDVFKYTNKQIGILRMGSSHMDTRAPDVVNTGLSKEIITLQDLCKQNNISYIVLEPESVIETFPKK